MRGRQYPGICIALSSDNYDYILYTGFTKLELSTNPCQGLVKVRSINTVLFRHLTGALRKRKVNVLASECETTNIHCCSAKLRERY